MIRRGIGRLRRITLRPKSRTGRRVVILLYHRVVELRTDPWCMGVRPCHFAEHLEVLRRYAHPLGLQQLAQGLLGGVLPDRAVAVTFDDGYADNLHGAKPLLERYDIPATVFLTTGYVGQEREFWWDELDRLLMQPETLPGALGLTIKGSTYRWELEKGAHYSEDAASWSRRRGTSWRSIYRSRHHLYRSLWDLLYSLTEGERQRVLDKLRAWAGAEPMVRPTHRPLSLDEVVTLAQGDLIEIGAHTQTHPALATLPVASQRYEILESKARLEEILGREVTSFSYPHGSLSTKTVAMVREAGFARACSDLADFVGPTPDPFQLPRTYVQDWGGREFARRLAGWLDS